MIAYYMTYIVLGAMFITVNKTNYLLHREDIQLKDNLNA